MLTLFTVTSIFRILFSVLCILTLITYHRSLIINYAIFP